MSHDDRAADVLAEQLGNLDAYWMEDFYEATSRILDALSAAGLAVVPVGEPPPWMPGAYSDEYPDGVWLTRDGSIAHGPANSSDERLYRLTEGNDDV